MARYERRRMSAPFDSIAAPRPALLDHRSYVAYWCARTATNGAYQMQAVAVGWQIYELTGSAFDLGLVGLVQFFPVVVLGLLIGHIADRYDRRVVVGTCQIVKALAAAAFAIGTLGGFLSRDVMLAILFVSGTARAFETPTMHTLVPGIVPPALLPRAIAASSTASQTAIICGPAIGGLLYLFGASTVYLTCMAVFAGEHPGQLHPDAADAARQEAGHVRGGVRGLSLHPPQPGGARRNLTRSVCSAARRRHRPVADLCQGRTRGRPVGARAASLGAGDRGRSRSRSGSRTTRSSGASAMCCSLRSPRSEPPPWRSRSRPRS
jgi:hypothetical protein